MAYATSNPPILETQSIAGPRRWSYSSADASTVVDASGYFTNGYELGMRINDTIMVTDTDTGLTTSHVVVSEADPTVDIADGVAITSITDSD